MKPIAWYDPSNGMVSTDQDCPLFTPLGQVWGLYPKRDWVGLTDEHKEGLIYMTDPNPEPHHLRELIDVVEFQLKEKNT
jgi:hypothetical protein